MLRSYIYRTELFPPKHKINLFPFPATSSAHLEDLAFLDDQQRHLASKMSLKMAGENSGNRNQQDPGGKD